MSTILLKRGTTLPNSGLTIGEPLFVNSTNSESLHIANSSSTTIPIGPVRSHQVSNNGTRFLLLSQTFPVGSNVNVFDNKPLINIDIFSNFTGTTLSGMLGFVDNKELTIIPRVRNVSNNETESSSSVYLETNAIVNNTDIWSGYHIIAGNPETDMAEYSNRLPNVDGILLSTGHTEQMNYSLENIPSTWKLVKYNSVNKKLYADDTSQIYTAGIDINISNNTINAVQQIPQIFPIININNNNIVYTEVQTNSTKRRNYGIAELTDEVTYTLKFDIRTTNIEHSLVLLVSAGAKTAVINKPIVTIDSKPVTRFVYDDVYPITVHYLTPGDALFFEVIVRTYNEDTVAILHCKKMIYE